MIYLEKTDIHATVCTWIYCAFWQKWVANGMGERVYINWPAGKSLIDLYDANKFSQVPNMFEWYFKQPDGTGERTDTWTWEGWQDTSGTGGLYAQPLETIKQFYRENLIFNEDTNWRGLELKNKYNIDFNNTIGITWRGTDIYLDGRPRIPIEAYFPWIDRALAENPNYRIACTAEEDGILDPLLARYPQAFKINEFYQAPKGGKHNPERFSPMSGYERGLQPTLMVWLFSKCAWYIKNRSSAAAVASWLSTGNIVSIAHEETLSYVKMDDQVEYKGIKYHI